MVIYEEYGIPKCCLKNCLKYLSIEELMKLRGEYHNLKEIDKKLFIKSKVVESQNGEGTNKYYINQKCVCLNAFTTAYGVSKHLVYSKDYDYSQNRVKIKRRYYYQIHE